MRRAALLTLVCWISVTLPGYNMDTIWINPVVAGHCDSQRCGARCCHTRIYTAFGVFTEQPCEYLDTKALICTIYETRPEGCRTYPEVRNLLSFTHPGCGYYLMEQQAA